jgi:hypothetical protein
LFFIHPATMHRNAGENRIDLAKVRRRQLDVDCAEVLVQVKPTEIVVGGSSVKANLSRALRDGWLQSSLRCAGRLD